MSEFINTIDAFGDEFVTNAIIERSIAEFKDSRIKDGVKKYAFYGCTALTEVNLPLVTTLYANAFYGCTALTEVNLPLVRNMTGGNQFRDCTALTKIILPSLESTTTGSEVRGCLNLKLFDCVLKNIRNQVFQNNKSMVALVLRGDYVCSLGSVNTFSATPIESGEGYIYVPRSRVEEYKVATNWSIFADQFRALEDYTVDGTITGELDESKI